MKTHIPCSTEEQAAALKELARTRPYLLEHLPPGPR
jgi:hypothetical protein